MEIDAKGDDLEPELQDLLHQIGYESQALKPKDRKLIYQVLEQHGGIEQLRNEMYNQNSRQNFAQIQQPPPPPRVPSAPTVQKSAAPPPPPPPRYKNNFAS